MTAGTDIDLAMLQASSQLLGTNGSMSHHDGWETLDDFVAVDEPGAAPLVGSPGAVLIPADGIVMTYGDGGAGKTTLEADLACHLAAGDDWLGISISTPIRVGLVENEGPRPLFRKKLRRKRDAWQGSRIGDRLAVLAEPWAQLDLTDELWRQFLADSITRRQLDLIALGPVTRIGMREAGTLQEVIDFTLLLSDVRRRVDRPVTFWLVHHENKGGQVSGAWEGAVDTMLHVQGQGHGRTRVFVQKARWSSEHHATAMQLRWADGDSFEVEDKPAITEESIAEEILDAVVEMPGESWTKIREHVSGNGTQVQKVRDRLIKAGRIVNRPARKGGFNLWHADDPANRSEAGTVLERLPFHPAGAAEHPNRSTVPPYKGNGYRNGTDPAPAAAENGWGAD